MLLHFAGLKIQDTYFTLQKQQDRTLTRSLATADEYIKALHTLTKYFTSEVNTLHERQTMKLCLNM